MNVFNVLMEKHALNVTPISIYEEEIVIQKIIVLLLDNMDQEVMMDLEFVHVNINMKNKIYQLINIYKKNVAQ